MGFLLVEQKQEGIFLFRFTASGKCIADTWHLSVEDAKIQANFEFGGCLSEWQVVPETVTDVLEFIFSKNS